MSDKEIIGLLNSDPERGMEQIITQYGSLLWAVASHHISQPEDIKECVNDTYAEFFRAKDDFDESKGSLKNFLVIIAQRLAIKKYYENARQPQTAEQTEEKGTDPITDFEQKEDIERYLHMLDTVDEKIIRMKYYEGMTAKEIAESLDIPYETVKKRHQRSLKKLRKYMTLGIIIAIIAALLTGCVWFILRYFGIVPGYGINKNPDLPAYILEEDASVSSHYADITFTYAYWMNNQLTLDCEIEFDEEKLKEGYYSRNKFYGKMDDIQGVKVSYSEVADELVFLGSIDRTQGTNVNEERRYIIPCELPDGFDKKSATLPLTILWKDGAQLDIELKKAESEISFEKAGYYSMTEDEGGLLAMPRIEDGNLIVAIYPLSEGDYVIQPYLSKGVWDGNVSDDSTITVTAEDGTVMEGYAEGYSPFSGYEFYEWNFGPAQPGKYTLNVPFVYQQLKEDLIGQSITQRVWFDNDGGTLGTEYNVHDAVVRLTDYKVSEHREYMPNIDEITKLINELYSECVWWDAEYEIENKNEDRKLVWFNLNASDPEGVQSIEKKTKDGQSANVNVCHCDMHCEHTTDPESGKEYYKPEFCRLYIYGGENYVDLTLNYYSLGYQWKHPFTIEFEVE